jgi:hypothetical protein
VIVGVGVYVRVAVWLGVNVLEGVKVFVGTNVLEAVGEPMKILGGSLKARETRNCSTIPRCAETRWIMGQI